MNSERKAIFQVAPKFITLYLSTAQPEGWDLPPSPLTFIHLNHKLSGVFHPVDYTFLIHGLFSWVSQKQITLLAFLYLPGRGNVAFRYFRFQSLWRTTPPLLPFMEENLQRWSLPIPSSLYIHATLPSRDLCWPCDLPWSTECIG